MSGLPSASVYKLDSLFGKVPSSSLSPSMLKTIRDASSTIMGMPPVQEEVKDNKINDALEGVGNAIKDAGSKLTDFTNDLLEKGELTLDDALRLYREAGSPTISNEPSVLAKIFPKKFNVTEESDSFRPHASINKIYIPPRAGMAGFKNFLAEIAHLHPDYRFLPTIEGTFDRIKRSYKESDFLIPIGLIPFPSTIADKSNYKSEKDFEYKTHQIAEKNILDDYFDKKEFINPNIKKSRGHSKLEV